MDIVVCNRVNVTITRHSQSYQSTIHTRNALHVLGVFYSWHSECLLIWNFNSCVVANGKINSAEKRTLQTSRIMGTATGKRNTRGSIYLSNQYHSSKMHGENKHRERSDLLASDVHNSNERRDFERIMVVVVVFRAKRTKKVHSFDSHRMTIYLCMGLFQNTIMV